MKKITFLTILLLSACLFWHMADVVKAQESKIYLGDNRGYNSYSGGDTEIATYNGFNKIYDGISPSVLTC